MKIPHHAQLAVALALGIAASCYSPVTLSEDENSFKVGQVVYAKRATIACMSKEELQRAQNIAKQGDKAAFFRHLNGHCGAFEKVEAVKILSIEPGAGDPVFVVTDLDDPSAPAKLWMTGASLSLSK